MKVLNIYKKIIVGMNKVLDVLTITAMLGMVGVVFYQVIMRQIFARPPIWGEEVSVTFMIWFVFLGIVLGLHENLHIGIAMFVNKLPKKAQFVIEIIVNLLIMLHATILLVYGYTYTANILAFGNRLTATGLPAGIHYVVTPIAGALMILVLLGKIAEQLLNRKELE